MKKLCTWKICFTILTLVLSIIVISIIGYSQDTKFKSYPERTITWIIPYGAGGSTDMGVRTMADEMSKILGVTILPLNKPGAGGIIAADYVVKQPPDGYTIYTGNIAQNGIQLAIDTSATYNNDDFTFIALYLIQEPLVVVKADSPWKTMDDLVKAAKKNPGTITYSTSGIGTSLHLSAELIQKEAEIKLNHVPFKSGPKSMAAILGGHVNFGMHLSGDAKSMLEAGEIRALATLAPQRLESLPDVPTMIELGYKNANIVSWHGLVAPKGLSEEIVEKLDQAVKVALESVSVQSRMKTIGFSPKYMGHEEFEKFVKESYEKVVLIVDSAGLKR